MIKLTQLALRIMAVRRISQVLRIYISNKLLKGIATGNTIMTNTVPTVRDSRNRNAVIVAHLK